MDRREGASGTPETMYNLSSATDNSDAESVCSDKTPTGIVNLRKRLRALQEHCPRCKIHLEKLKKASNAMDKQAAINHVQTAHSANLAFTKDTNTTKRTPPTNRITESNQHAPEGKGSRIIQNPLIPAIISCAVGDNDLFVAPRTPAPRATTNTLTTNTATTTTTATLTTTTTCTMATSTAVTNIILTDRPTNNKEQTEEQSRKRGRSGSNEGSPPISKKTSIKHLLRQENPPIPLRNRFQALQTADTMDTTELETTTDEPDQGPSTSGQNTRQIIRDTTNATIQTKKRTTDERPPPIILQGHITKNADFQVFKTEIDKTVKRGYTVKHTKNNTILYINDLNEHLAYRRMLQNEKVLYHSYDTRQEKTHDFIVK